MTDLERISLSPNLIWKTNYDKDVSKLQERASKFLSNITDHGEVEREGGITSTGHTDIGVREYKCEIHEARLMVNLACAHKKGDARRREIRTPVEYRVFV